MVHNETELLAKCQAIEGLSFTQLAAEIGWHIPEHHLNRKGWLGQAIEKILETTAGNRSVPDFFHLGIELKTLPINQNGVPAESTFVTAIPLLTIHQETWPNSQCFEKLKRVLWLPVEADKKIPYSHRRVGRAFLWSPNEQQEQILSEDWNEIVTLISAGQFAELNSSIGRFLQVRPKAAHSKSLCYAMNEFGDKIQTLPRGFYLRSRFTASLL